MNRQCLIQSKDEGAGAIDKNRRGGKLLTRRRSKMIELNNFKGCFLNDNEGGEGEVFKNFLVSRNPKVLEKIGEEGSIRNIIKRRGGVERV